MRAKLTGGTVPAARWQSSQRPLFVRTVFVNGLRHAILSADDPLLQYRDPAPVRVPSVGRPASCSTSSSSRAHHCDLEHCLVKLQLVLAPSRSARASTPPRRRSSPPKSAGRCESPSAGVTSMVGQYRRPYLPCAFPSSSEEEPEPYPDADADIDADAEPWMLSDVETLLPDLRLNPLSERVLQWLDLAAKSAGKDTRYSVPLPPPPDVSKRKLQRREHTTMLDVSTQGMSSVHRRRRVVIDETERCNSETEEAPEPPPPSPPPLSIPTVKQGGSRPQLHIFMPTLPRDRPSLHHQHAADDASECDSCWSDA